MIMRLSMVISIVTWD